MPTAPRRIRILIVDDDHLMRTLARTYLSSHRSFEVVGEANDGVECLAAVREHAPDLVLLDLMMPRMDGFQALPRIHEEDPQAVVIVHTSLSEPGVKERVAELGARGLIEKTGSLRALPQRILELLRSRGGPAPDGDRPAEAWHGHVRP